MRRSRPQRTMALGPPKKKHHQALGALGPTWAKNRALRAATHHDPTKASERDISMGAVPYLDREHPRQRRADR